jgi:hypothetical protein
LQHQYRPASVSASNGNVRRGEVYADNRTVWRHGIAQPSEGIPRAASCVEHAHPRLEPKSADRVPQFGLRERVEKAQLA